MSDSVDPQFCFLQDACETLARNAGDLLELACRHTTVEDLMGIVKSLPKSQEDLLCEQWQKGMLSRALEASFSRKLTSSEKQRRDQINDNFLGDIPNRPRHAVEMLQAAFIGVLGGIDWTETVSERIVVVSAVPKPQERWWWKKG